jgi:hypothetical protein
MIWARDAGLPRKAGATPARALHWHDWRRVYPDAIGRYSKRNSEVDAIYVRGDVESCECGRSRIKCHGLTPVEVDS